MEIKRCPFCGGEAVVEREYYVLSEDELFGVVCEDCGGWCETPQEAIEAWNKRVSNKLKEKHETACQV